MKQYSKKQITEAIAYWQNQLKQMNETFEVQIKIPSKAQLAIDQVKKDAKFPQNSAAFSFADSFSYSSIYNAIVDAFGRIDDFELLYGNGSLNEFIKKCQALSEKDCNAIVFAYHFQGAHKSLTTNDDLDEYDSVPLTKADVQYAGYPKDGHEFCAMMAFGVKINVVM